MTKKKKKSRNDKNTHRKERHDGDAAADDDTASQQAYPPGSTTACDSQVPETLTSVQRWILIFQTKQLALTNLIYYKTGRRTTEFTIQVIKIYKYKHIDIPCWGGGGWGGGLAVLFAFEADLGRRAPSEARLQLARRPLMIGVASSHAFLAASASLNVT